MTDDFDLRFTHDHEVIMGIPDKPDNAVVYSICNSPTEKLVNRVDGTLRELVPNHSEWGKFVERRTKNNRGRGWHEFEGQYLEYLSENKHAYKWCQRLKAQSKVRPIYICHHPRDKRFSPAWLLINFTEHAVELPTEIDQTKVEKYA